MRGLNPHDCHWTAFQDRLRHGPDQTRIGDALAGQAHDHQVKVLCMRDDRLNHVLSFAHVDFHLRQGSQHGVKALEGLPPKAAVAGIDMKDANFDWPKCKRQAKRQFGIGIPAKRHQHTRRVLRLRSAHQSKVLPKALNLFLSRHLKRLDMAWPLQHREVCLLEFGHVLQIA